MPRKIRSYITVIGGQPVIINVFEGRRVCGCLDLVRVNVRPKCRKIEMGMDGSGRVEELYRS